MKAEPWQAVEEELTRIGITGVCNQSKALGLGQRWRARKQRPISAERLMQALADFSHVQSMHCTLQAYCLSGEIKWGCSITYWDNSK